MNWPKLYINTCDATMFFLPIFNYFQQKYWNDQKTIILGYKQPNFPLLSNQEYISMAPVQEGGVNSWSTYLKKYFESIDDEIILWGIDDHLIVDKVDKEILIRMWDMMNEDKTIGRIGLTYGISNREHTIIETIKRPTSEYNIYQHVKYDVIELTQCETPGNPFAYRIDCNFGFWRREYLLKYLEEGMTPWQFEVEGSKKARNDGWRILATKRKYGVLKVEGKRSIAPGKVNLLGVKFEDILNLLNQGLVTKQEMVGVPDWL